MSAIDDLVALRQRSIDTFIVSGGRKKDASFLGEQEAASFTSDPALLTHPVYSTSIEGNSEAFQRSLESTIAKLTNSRLTADALQLSSVRYYGSRDNKYGASCISFDQEGVLFACGGSNGIIKVYDFDECYAASTLRRENATVSPVVSFDTRRDVTCISWSHLRPDDIAVSYLFRPDIQVFDLSEADDASCDPKHSLVTDNKGSGGHNVVLYWHSVKLVPASAIIASAKNIHTNNKNSHNNNNNNNHNTVRSAAAGAGEKKHPEQREVEGIVAGSVTGYIRYWHTSTANKSCAWNVMADPHRTALTATAVVALQAIHSSNHSNNHSTNHSTLLLAATAQGVITLWDLNDLKAAAFGSIQPEPRCVRRIDYTNQLMLYEGRTLIGVTPVQYYHCRYCQQKKSKQDVCTDSSNHACSSSTANEHIQILSGATITSSNSSSSNTGNVITVDSSVLLTTSYGSVYTADLNTERITASSPHTRNINYSTKYENDDLEMETCTHSKLHSVSDPNNPIVLSYEELRRELASAEQGARDLGSQSLRSVLPAVVPAWNSHHYLQQQQQQLMQESNTKHNHLLSRLTQSTYSTNNYSHMSSTSLNAAAADVAIVAVPYQGSSSSSSTSTVLNAYDISGTYGLKVFPNTHNLNGLCSVSGKDSDPYSGVVRSNMRRSESVATTLPGFIMTAESGSYEIITSVDLQTYLCASVSSSSVYAKSSVVEFDWSVQDLVFGHAYGKAEAKDGVSDINVHRVYENGVLYPHTVSANTVEGTSLHRLILQNAYVGPAVVNGLPRVYIRTALLPSGRTATLTYNTSKHTNITNSNSIYSSSSTTSTSSIASNRVSTNILPLHGKNRFSQQITALAAHPIYPILVAGTRTDDVILLNPCNTPCIEDRQQEVYPADNTISALAAEGKATLSSDGNTTSAIVSLDSREDKAALQKASRRALHRVGKALPRYDSDLTSATPTEESAEYEVKLKCELEEELKVDMTTVVGSVSIDETSQLGSARSEIGDDDGDSSTEHRVHNVKASDSMEDVHEKENGHTSADATEDVNEEGCASLAQLLEQYEVDPSVLTAAQLARIKKATLCTSEELNSPLYKARQQMLRARAHHKTDTMLGSVVGKELEVPDLAVFTTSATTTAAAAVVVSGDNSSVLCRSYDNCGAGQIHSAIPDRHVGTITDSAAVSLATAEPIPRSLSAIHSIHHVNNAQKGEHLPTAKRAKILGLFAATTATTTSSTSSTTISSATNSNKTLQSSSRSTTSTSKYGAFNKKDNHGSNTNTSNSGTTHKHTISTNISTSTNSNLKRNTLSKLLQPKSLPPHLPLSHSSHSGSHVPSAEMQLSPLKGVSQVAQLTQSVTHSATSSNSSRTVLSVVNGNTSTAATSGNIGTTIGVKRTITNAHPATTTVPVSEKSKPKSVSNILNFFSAVGKK